jgi:glycosyltransferase involved in cell wall biosynthesis
VLVNGSTDNSTLILESLKKQFLNKLDYLVINQSGRGRALKTYWGQSQSDVLAFMDIDLAVSLNHINDLIEPILNNQADLVIGSRFMSSSIVERSLKRKIVSWVYVNISKIIVPHKNIDLQCGFKAISKAGFLKIKKFLLDDYWFFDTELIILAEVANLKIVEIGVNWQEKRKSAKKSKVKLFRDSCLFIKNLFIFRKRLKKIKKNNWA